ncbi:AMP-binding protein [Arenicella xantha]|uniref:AMP-binding enzyme n=1 Tax=Arenicella xantha TaxID=644221 RepID=A0A395JQ12_9GAMM|nr:AMP-binding protein [Arenicella xantha]RBP53699.1 AMP-binding enzyme [Arenicella xantha]
MSDVTLLIQRELTAPVACLSKPLNQLTGSVSGSSALSGAPLIVSNAAFLNHVLRLAAVMPRAEHVINLCDNRYLFLVVLSAAIVNRQTCLLPANKNGVTQLNLAQRYAGCAVVHDGAVDIDASLDAMNVAECDWSLDESHQAIPSVPLDHLAAISFTSGSTGESKPNPKSWRTLQESTRINARYMLPNNRDVFYHLATVPGQHMWGFETSVLLPLFANACLVDARPLFPHDVRQALASLPAPRTLITTPVHLRALVASLESSAADVPAVELILCATAPLDQSLACAAEQVFDCKLREVYGCSEVGSMSIRRPSQTNSWTRFSDIQFISLESGCTRVDTDYLPAPVMLEDQLTLLDADTFELVGRASDQIKIAGKRGSLRDVNLVLNRFDGLRDGVVFFPQQDRAVPRLVALVCLKAGVAKTQLQTFLRQQLDSAFVPRPIYIVDELPREPNGKLPNASVLAIYDQLRPSSESVKTLVN